MKKRIAIVAALALCVSTCSTAFAGSSLNYIHDKNGYMIASATAVVDGAKGSASTLPDNPASVGAGVTGTAYGYNPDGEPTQAKMNTSNRGAATIYFNFGSGYINRIQSSHVCRGGAYPIEMTTF